MNQTCYAAAEISASDVMDGFELTLGDGEYYGDYYNKPLEKGQHYDMHIGFRWRLKVSCLNSK